MTSFKFINKYKNIKRVGLQLTATVKSRITTGKGRIKIQGYIFQETYCNRDGIIQTWQLCILYCPQHMKRHRKKQRTQGGKPSVDTTVDLQVASNVALRSLSYLSENKPVVLLVEGA